MRILKVKSGLLTVAMITALVIGLNNSTQAEERSAADGENPQSAGQIENNETTVRPAEMTGPPAWVVELWQSGNLPQRPVGPPPWIAARQARAVEAGLPGPPPEVLEAWESGNGFSLPDPPDFVLEIRGLWF